MKQFTNAALLLILGLTPWLGAAQDSRLNESAMPPSCRRDAIRESLKSEGLELSEENTQIKQSLCLMAHSPAAGRDVKALSITLNYAPNSCTEEAILAAFDGLNGTAEPLLKGKVQLRLAVCAYARAGTHMRKLDSLKETDLKTLKTALSHVREASIKGLDSNSQSFAFFLEGILEASRAEILYQSFVKKPKDNNIAERTEFCQSRRMALASFASVDWGTFDFEFVNHFVPVPKAEVPTAPQDFVGLTEALPALMTSSFTGTHGLSSVQASTCGEFNALGDQEKTAIADKAVDAVMGEYFGATGAVTAMLASKQQRVEVPKEAFRKKVEELEKRGRSQAQKHDLVKGTFDSHFKDAIGRLLKDYEDAYATIYAIDDWARRWQAGLMLSPQGTNTAVELRNALDNLKGNVNEVTLGEFQQKLDSFQNNLKVALDRPRQFIQNTRMLCRINYCEINGQYAAKRATVCTTVDFEKSPLCNAQAPFKLSGQDTGKTVREICQESGVEEKYLQASLTTAVRDECLKKLASEAAAP